MPEPGPPIHRIDHISGNGRWSLLERRPAVALRPLVRGYRGYRETGGRPVRRRELPSTTVPLILNLGAPFELHETDGWRCLKSSFLAGLHDRPALVGSSGSAFCMQVDLSPLGALRLLGQPIAPLRNAVVDLDLLLGAEARDLAGQLHDAGTWAGRFALLDAALARRLAAAPLPPPLLRAAWEAIERGAGTSVIGRLAQRLDCSRKHLSGLFRRELGMSPKQLARIARFERATSLLDHDARVPLAEVAQTCGYYDQAHLCRDVRAFAGESPTALARRTLADGTGVMADPG